MIRFPFYLTGKQFLLAVIIFSLLVIAGRFFIPEMVPRDPELENQKSDSLCWEIPKDDPELQDIIDVLEGKKVWNGKKWRKIRSY